MNKTLGSLFDGSGGFPLGGLLCGIEPVWSSEVEPFPIRVTTKRMPGVQHHGDINKINGAEVPPVDIITGGFCCQDLSVAGKRAGIHGERSGLFFQITRIVKEMLAATGGKYPRFVVLENVPGMYSSGKGRDYLEVLNELIKIKQEGFAPDETMSIPMPQDGKWSTAGEIVGDGFSLGWRTFDAQFWGVAQRRRRCYIVLDLTGGCAGKILFDESRLRGNPPQGCFAGQTTAGTAPTGAGGAVCVLNDQGGSFMDVSEDVTGTLRSQEHGHQPIVFEPGAMSRVGGHVWDGEPTGALRADMGDNRLAVAIPINTQVATRHISPGEGTGFGVGDDGDPAYTIQAGHSHAVATRAGLAVENRPQDSRVKINEDGIVQTLDARMGMGGGNVPLVLNERQYALTVGEDVANTLTGTDYKGTQCVFEPKTLKIRSGCEGGGKGALVQDNLSATLSTSNDQTVFVPKMYGIDSQNSNSMKSGNPNSGIHEMDISRTLDTGACSGNGGQVVVFDGKQVTSKDNRSNPQPGDPCHTLASGSADSAVICLEGNGTRPSHKGNGYSEEGVSYTLNSVEQHGVAYGIDRAAFNQGENAQYKPQIDVEKSATVVARGPNAVAHPSYAMTTGSYMQVCEEKAPTLQARDYKDAPAVSRPQYVVRRLTPTECALLQGFPPSWCCGLETPEPTEEDIAFWSEVWETHRLIAGTSSKPKTRNQILKWLKNPHSDAAEYKMWGNGVALPCVYFVLSGIVYYTQSGD